MKRFAIFSLLLLSLFVLIPTAPLLTGCAGTKSSQVLYTSTEALGKAVAGVFKERLGSGVPAGGAR